LWIQQKIIEQVVFKHEDLKILLEPPFCHRKKGSNAILRKPLFLKLNEIRRKNTRKGLNINKKYIKLSLFIKTINRVF
jgi:hypothetical protein